MARQSKIVTAIETAVINGKLKEPFSVAEVNSACKNLLAKSPSFLSKHRKGNPGGYTVYFMQDKNGKYSLI
jgi:hypothetical protein